MKLGEFYEDKRRRTSGEVPLAEDWTSKTDPDATFKLFWIVETGEVCALRVGPVVMIPRPPTLYGVYVPKMESMGVENNEISILGHSGRLPMVTELVAGAPQTTIEWMRQELETSG